MIMILLVNSCSSHIISPKDGEIWTPGFTKTIKWDNITSHNIQINLEIYNGTEWLTNNQYGFPFLSVITDSLVNEYDWYIPLSFSEYFNLEMKFIIRELGSDIEHVSNHFYMQGININNNLNYNRTYYLDNNIYVSWSSMLDNNFSIYIYPQETSLYNIDSLSGISLITDEIVNYTNKNTNSHTYEYNIVISNLVTNISNYFVNGYYKLVISNPAFDVYGISNKIMLEVPTHSPTSSPTKSPSFSPTSTPTKEPSTNPTTSPSSHPTFVPTIHPSCYPSSLPSSNPSHHPSMNPSNSPSSHPSHHPSMNPSYSPSMNPSYYPTNSPSFYPSISPSYSPSMYPSHHPSNNPSFHPSISPTYSPSMNPSYTPSTLPSFSPSLSPSINPTYSPSTSPTHNPSMIPSYSPSMSPTYFPSTTPTTPYPSSIPTQHPSCYNITYYLNLTSSTKPDLNLFTNESSSEESEFNYMYIIIIVIAVLAILLIAYSNNKVKNKKHTKVNPVVKNTSTRRAFSTNNLSQEFDKDTVPTNEIVYYTNDSRGNSNCQTYVNEFSKNSRSSNNANAETNIDCYYGNTLYSQEQRDKKRKSNNYNNLNTTLKEKNRDILLNTTYTAITEQSNNSNDPFISYTEEIISIEDNNLYDTPHLPNSFTTNTNTNTNYNSSSFSNYNDTLNRNTSRNNNTTRNNNTSRNNNRNSNNIDPTDVSASGYPSLQISTCSI